MRRYSCDTTFRHQWNLKGCLSAHIILIKIYYFPYQFTNNVLWASKILVICIYTNHHEISAISWKLCHLLLLAPSFSGGVDFSSKSLFSIPFNQSKMSLSPSGLTHYTTIISSAVVLHTHSFARKACWKCRKETFLYANGENKKNPN